MATNNSNNNDSDTTAINGIVVHEPISITRDSRKPCRRRRRRRRRMVIGVTAGIVVGGLVLGPPGAVVGGVVGGVIAGKKNKREGMMLHTNEQEAIAEPLISPSVHHSEVVAHKAVVS